MCISVNQAEKVYIANAPMQQPMLIRVKTTSIGQAEYRSTLTPNINYVNIKYAQGNAIYYSKGRQCICHMSSIESFISCLPAFTMSTVTHVDKKLYSITGWWVVILRYGTEQMNTGWVESSDSPLDYSLQWD